MPVKITLSIHPSPHSNAELTHGSSSDLILGILMRNCQVISTLGKIKHKNLHAFMCEPPVCIGHPITPCRKTNDLITL